MKKVFLLLLVSISCFTLFTGCSKSTSNATTVNPYLTADVNNPAYGKYSFTSATVVPNIVDTQTHDTTTTLIVIGDYSGSVFFADKIVLAITKYKRAAGVFSIIQGQASAAYVHDDIYDYATGGVVAITNISANSVIGYFSFTTANGIIVTNGEFSVPKP